MKLMVDPPEGWRYGFPKIWDSDKYPDPKVWLITEGYPAKDITNYTHIIFWEPNDADYKP